MAGLTQFEIFFAKLPQLGFSLDLSKMNFSENWLESLEPALETALSKLEKLDKGSLANADEKRMVGHYWLRNSALAPSKEISEAIEAAISEIENFKESIFAGSLLSQNQKKFRNVLIAGIGGSALGPQLLSDCFWDLHPNALKFYFCDNTDPDGIRRTLKSIEDELAETLVFVVSKSGGTRETFNASKEIEAAFQARDLKFSNSAVAITVENSKLDKRAKEEGWLEKFYIWDWVGGRTSISSAVGLLPLALLGCNIREFLSGASEMDQISRNYPIGENPAALIAASWFVAGEGKGNRSLVVLPYKDRLLLIGRYLQQLVMESLGKRTDKKGNEVFQGISVFGNKGSTDQHAYIQQLRDGKNDFVANFIQVLQDHQSEETKSLEIEPGISSGDYLQGFLLGTSLALSESNRQSYTITLNKLNEKSLGALLALYERATGIYAELIGINAYNQPGVEAGKKAANKVIKIQAAIQQQLKNKSDKEFTAEELAKEISHEPQSETIYWILEHLAQNKRGLIRTTNSTPSKTKYKTTKPITP